jgi:hypothetical protein
MLLSSLPNLQRRQSSLILGVAPKPLFDVAVIRDGVWEEVIFFSFMLRIVWSEGWRICSSFMVRMCCREGLLELWGVVACSGYIEGTPHCSN